MLPSAPDVLLARQGFADAQPVMGGVLTPLGFYTIGWYGLEIDDERGSFAVVNAAGPLIGHIGDYLQIEVGRQRSVFVYVTASKTNLLTDIALTRRSYFAVSQLAIEPQTARVSVVL